MAEHAEVGSSPACREIVDAAAHGGLKSIAMAERDAEFPGNRVAATVKRYDAAKGYGFLAPGGGMHDIFCQGDYILECPDRPKMTNSVIVRPDYSRRRPGSPADSRR